MASVDAAEPVAEPATPEEHLAFLNRWGYVVVRGAIGGAECDALREHVSATTDEAHRLGRNDLFGNIQESENRWDLKLDLCAPVVAALNCFAGSCTPLVAGFMGSPSVKLVELAGITSDPGAKAQPVHADTMHGVTRFLQSDLVLPEPPDCDDEGERSEDEDAGEDLGQVVRAVATDTALICSSLAALQDISEDMGPTHVWPGTNTVEHHATLWGTAVGGKLDVPTADTAFGVPHRKMTLRKGDLVLYDSRTMHCGGPNFSESGRRSVLVISCMSPGIRPDGTTWTMLPALRNKLRLKSFPLQIAEAELAPTGRPGSVSLPEPTAAAADGGPAEEPGAGRLVPPVDEWDAAVQCSLCRQWRPCTVEEAPRFAGGSSGFMCSSVGFSCMQPQVYSQDEIDKALD